MLETINNSVQALAFEKEQKINANALAGNISKFMNAYCNTAEIESFSIEQFAKDYANDICKRIKEL